MDKLRVYEKPSQIKFTVVESDGSEQPMLSQARRGDTFLREGAICMAATCNINPKLIEQLTGPSKSLINNTLDRLFWVCNLQSGRVYASEDMPIKWVKLTVHVDGEN